MKRWALLATLVLVVACQKEEGGPPDTTVSDAQPETVGDVPGDPGAPPPLTGNASITAKVKLVKNFPIQVVDLLRQYLTTPDYIFRGDLYLQVCSDGDCTQVLGAKKVLEGELFSTGFAKDVTVDGLPQGKVYLRFFVDTKYSQEYGGVSNGNFGPMDVLQIAAGTDTVSVGKNPAPATTEANLSDGQTTDIGEVLLGHIVFEDPSFKPTPEPGLLLTASSGKDVYRNVIKVVDLQKYEVIQEVALTHKGAEFKGDICGFVPTDSGLLYVIAVGAEGAYVFSFNTQSLQFGPQSVLIPHPDYKGGSTEGLDPEKYPWPCRGSVVKKDGKEFLYLIAYKGAGALTNSAPYPLVVVETTGFQTGNGKLVKAYDKDVDPFFDTSRIIRGVATDGEKLYLLEASWSKHVDKNTVYVFTIASDGTVAMAGQWDSGTAEDKCDSTNNWVPALKVVQWGGAPKVLVGNDDDISIYGTDGKLVGKIDTRDYGRLITSFAVSPDGKTLYAMPNCKSATKKASVAAGLKGKRVDLDRHAVVEIDLGSDPSNPVIFHKDRDFDADGNADGGIDLEFLYLKASLLRWCESCQGVVPPTAYTGPEIVAGRSSLFLRGTGIQSDEKNSSGLGQVADLGVYDLAKGLGVMFRDYQIWLDGPSSRWGFDLNPSNPIKDYSDDVSTSAMVYVAK